MKYLPDSDFFELKSTKYIFSLRDYACYQLKINRDFRAHTF